MEHVKRIEIVTLSLEIGRLCRALEKAGISAYTVLDDARGKGDRGVRGNDELSNVFKNSFLLTTCAPADIDRVLDAIRPILTRFGGMCLVSDAQYLVHETRDSKS